MRRTNVAAHGVVVGLVFVGILIVLGLVGIPGAAGETPRSCLKLDDDVLRVTAGTPVRMILELPRGETWANANLGQFQVRSFGRVESVLSDAIPRPDSREVIFRFPTPGTALVILAAGPAALKGEPDSWQRTPYCTKLIVRVAPRDDDPARDAARVAPPKGPDVTAKVGSKIEIRPTVDPTALSSRAVKAGADFPVRIYIDGSKEAGVEVRAHGPGGSSQSTVTDSSGYARFKIRQEGRWLIRTSKRVGDVTYRADLLFEVSPGVAEKPR